MASPAARKATWDDNTCRRLALTVKTFDSQGVALRQRQCQGVCRLNAASARQLHAGVFDQRGVQFTTF
jgi:hypothetical protein